MQRIRKSNRTGIYGPVYHSTPGMFDDDARLTVSGRLADNTKITLNKYLKNIHQTQI